MNEIESSQIASLFNHIRDLFLLNLKLKWFHRVSSRRGCRRWRRWWSWRWRWWKRRSDRIKKTAPESHNFLLGTTPGIRGGVPAHPLSRLYAPGTDRREGGTDGSQGTGVYIVCVQSRCAYVMHIEISFLNKWYSFFHYLTSILILLLYVLFENF